MTLSGLSFSPGTAGFNVYRGSNPTQLLRIAAERCGGDYVHGCGSGDGAVGPPDANYDHANFYWRLELQPETGANILSATTIGNSRLGMLAERFQGRAGADHARNGRDRGTRGDLEHATTLTVTPPWTVMPDSTSYFVVADATWKFGGLSATSPVEFEVPNRERGDGGGFGAVGERAGSGKSGGAESADALADRRRSGGGWTPTCRRCRCSG